MSKELSRKERETIIINHFKGKDTPGYEVSKLPNGKYNIKRIPIDIEEEDDEIEEEEPKKKLKQKVNETFKAIQEDDDENEEEDEIEKELTKQPNIQKVKPYTRRRLIF